MSLVLVNILEQFLGTVRKHNEDTGQLAFDCPACSEDKGLVDGDGKGNLEVNYEMNKFKCWSCYETNHMYGSVLKLLKRYATPKMLRDYLLVKPDADFFTDRVREYEQVTLPLGFKRLAECTSSDFKSDEAKRYLRKRGITDSIINEYDIGYTTIGDYYNRIIIPSYDIDGELNYFIARWFPKEYNLLKYMNPVAEKQIIVFNEARINFDATIYIVEGVTDHIVTPNSIPLLGKVISEELIDLLYNRAICDIIIILDDDAWFDAVKLYNKLNFGVLMGRVKIVKPPSGYDPSKIFEVFGPLGMLEVLRTARILTEEESY